MDCLCFVKVNAWMGMHWWRPIKLATSCQGHSQWLPTNALTFTKHRQPMFNYNYTITPHLFCSNLPQIHKNNPAMCRFQQTISTRFTKHSIFINTACSLQLTAYHCIIISNDCHVYKHVSSLPHSYIFSTLFVYVWWRIKNWRSFFLWVSFNFHNIFLQTEMPQTVHFSEEISFTIQGHSVGV